MLKFNNARELIQHFEGFRSEAYILAGETHWTIGWGRYGVQSHETTTREEEDIWLEERINLERKFIHKLLPGLNLNQVEALISFSYNVGQSALVNSTLAKRIKANDPNASEEFHRWVKGSHGEPMEGLIIRRGAEKALFDKPIEESFEHGLVDLFEAACYTEKDIKHQQDAWVWLEERITIELLFEFTQKYRNLG